MSEGMKWYRASWVHFGCGGFDCYSEGVEALIAAHDEAEAQMVAVREGAAGDVHVQPLVLPDLSRKRNAFMLGADTNGSEK